MVQTFWTQFQPQGLKIVNKKIPFDPVWSIVWSNILPNQTRFDSVVRETRELRYVVSCFACCSQFLLLLQKQLPPPSSLSLKPGQRHEPISAQFDLLQPNSFCFDRRLEQTFYLSTLCACVCSFHTANFFGDILWINIACKQLLPTNVHRLTFIRLN